MFEIPFLGLYPLSINQKISLTSLERYVYSGQSDMETSFFSRYGFIFRFQNNHYCSLEKNAKFTAAADYKVQGSDWEGRGVTL